MLALGALSCASARGERYVDRRSAVRPDVGYLAAFLSIDRDTQTFLLTIEGPDGATRDLPFRDPSVAVHVDVTQPANRGLTSSKQVGMIALPPGEYRIVRWWVEELGPRVIPRSIAHGKPLGKPFTIRAGEVVFLGSLAAGQTHKFSSGGVVTTTWWIDPQPLTEDEAWTLFTDAYPGFVSAAFECRLCEGSPSVQ
jgi:hypothetical protein